MIIWAMPIVNFVANGSSINKGELNMEKYIVFIDVLAWIFAIISTGFVALRLIGYAMYDDLDKLRDKLNGVEARFPIINGGIVAIICWAWIIASYLIEGKLI